MEPAVDKPQEALAKALAGFRGDMPVVKRNGTGQQGNRSYKYADLSQVESTAQPHLKKHELAVTQPLVTEEDGHTYVVTIIRHSSGQMEKSKLRVPDAGSKPQEAGSVFTYYRRYAFSAALGIAIDGEDDDGDAGTQAVAARRQPASKSQSSSADTPKASDKKPASEKQRGYLATLAHKKGKDNAWVDATLEKVKTSADASSIIEKLSTLEDA